MNAGYLPAGPGLKDAAGVLTMAGLAALMCSDKAGNAATWCEDWFSQGTPELSPIGTAVFSAVFAAIARREGNFADARKHADAALALISPQRWGVAIGVPLGAGLLAATMMGDYEDAKAYLNTSAPEAMFATPFVLGFLDARGRYQLATGDGYGALADFETCGELMTRWGLDLPCIVPWRSGAAEACLSLRMDGRARNLAEQEVSLAGADHPRTRGISLRTLAATASPRHRAALLREAVDLLTRTGGHAELPFAFADLTRHHQALGEYRQAHVTANRARHLAGQYGVALDLPLLPGTQDPGTPDESLGGHICDLTEAELRVAKLAARGCTNREISNELCVTVSTVEQHLTRIYRKLKLHNRNGLPFSLSFPAVQEASPKYSA